MRLKLDENVPLRLIGMLTAQGHDVDTVVREGLVGRPDPEIVRAARAEARMVITADRGFPALAAHPAGHPGVVVLKSSTRACPRS